MAVKLSLLKSGETIISDIKELISSDKACGYLVTNPHIVEIRKSLLLVEEADYQKENVDVTLSPWLVLTSDKQMLVSYDWIVTVVEPISTLKQMYEEKVNAKTDQVSFTES